MWLTEKDMGFAHWVPSGRITYSLCDINMWRHTDPGNKPHCGICTEMLKERRKRGDVPK